MKKAFCAVFAIVIFAAGLLTGCTSSEPFDKLDITTGARIYGIMELDGNPNASYAVQEFSNRQGKTAYYISKDKTEAKKLYNDYVNRNSFFPKANPDEIIVIAAKEWIGSTVYTTDCYAIYFPEKSDAKAYFDECVGMMKSDRANKKGFKDGYAYAITYSLSANRDGNCDWMEGFYLKGNSVLVITGFSPINNVQNYSDVVYDYMNVVDPATLKN